MGLSTGTVNYYRQFRPGIPEGVAEALDQQATPPRPVVGVVRWTSAPGWPLRHCSAGLTTSPSTTPTCRPWESALRPKPHEGTRLSLAGSTTEDFMPPARRKVDLVTICRAFRCPVRAAAPARLDDQLVPDGFVATFGDSSFWTATSLWKEAA
ncbi:MULTISPECIES: hypothetical protein [Streptomyces]|uniref:hypothetical protein n=1 Tax=Streptomyces TaxID=1883 RepID=UPI00344D55CA